MYLNVFLAFKSRSRRDITDLWKRDVSSLWEKRDIADLWDKRDISDIWDSDKRDISSMWEKRANLHQYLKGLTDVLNE